MFVNVSDLTGLALDYWVARSLHDFVREIYFTDSGETVAVRGNDRGRLWDGRFEPSTSWEAASAVLERAQRLEVRERSHQGAAHCIADALLANGAPGLPLCDPARDAEDGTYTALLAPLGAKPTVWAACLFVDPIADIAVLGQPDNQALSAEADAYDALMASTGRLTIADAPAQGRELVTGFGDDRFEHFTPGEGLAWVLSLEGHWREGRVERRGGCLSFNPRNFFVGGMSGSPIVDANGAAIGVVSVDCMSPVTPTPSPRN